MGDRRRQSRRKDRAVRIRDLKFHFESGQIDHGQQRRISRNRVAIGGEQVTDHAGDRAADLEFADAPFKLSHAQTLAFDVEQRRFKFEIKTLRLESGVLHCMPMAQRRSRDVVTRLREIKIAHGPLCEGRFGTFQLAARSGELHVCNVYALLVYECGWAHFDPLSLERRLGPRQGR